MQNKFRGAVILAASADALGWITEHEKSKQNLTRKYGVDKILEFYDWKKKTGGRFYGYTDFIQKGSYSDDTQLMLSLFRSIQPDGSVDNNYFSKVELRDWLLYVRGGGKAIKTAARNLTKKKPMWDSNFYKTPKDKIAYCNAGANGAAMRMLPIILANYSDKEKMIIEVFKNSIVTHGHPRAIVGSILYALSVSYFLNQKELPDSSQKIIADIAIEFKTIVTLIEHIDNMGLLLWAKQWISFYGSAFEKEFLRATEETLELLRYIYRSIAVNVGDRIVFKNLGALTKETKGAGHISAVAALFMVAKHINQTPMQAVFDTVNMIGSDTDTIGLMCGSMIGAYLGFDKIPSNLKQVQDKKYLIECADTVLTNNIQNIKPIYRNNESILDKNSSPSLDFSQFSVNDRICLPSLGYGTIQSIFTEKTITTHKSVIIMNVLFDIGQSCKLTKIVLEHCIRS